MGEWHNRPLRLLDATGQPINGFRSELPDGTQHRVDVVAIPGMDRPALIYRHGHPGTWHTIAVTWLHNQLQGAWGWHPKVDQTWGTDIRAEGDRTLEVSGDPAGMGGYAWTRRYRVEVSPGATPNYLVALTYERLTAGAYPSDAEDLLTAAFVALWWGLDADLERYVPDATVRAAFKAGKVQKPAYVPPRAKVGKLVDARTYPRIEAAAPEPDGTSDFLVVVTHYEGGTFYSGKVAFGRAADGRLIVQAVQMNDGKFIY